MLLTAGEEKVSCCCSVRGPMRLREGTNAALVSRERNVDAWKARLHVLKPEELLVVCNSAFISGTSLHPTSCTLRAARCTLHSASHSARAWRHHSSSVLSDVCLFLLTLSSELFAGVPVDHLGPHPGWDQTPGGPVFSQPKGQSSKSGVSRGRFRVVTIVPGSGPNARGPLQHLDSGVSIIAHVQDTSRK